MQKKREAGNPQKRAKLEEQALEKGLQTALDEKNRGFRLLQKSAQQKNSGVFQQSEPTLPVKLETGHEPNLLVPITVRHKRLGLGIKVPEISIPYAAIKYDTILTDEEIAEFREKESSEAMSRFLFPDLCSTQKSCYHLDSEQGLTQPVEDFYWPDSVMLSLRPNTDSDMGESETSARCKTPDPPDQLAYKLRMVSNYLRSQYLYCTWCGIRFESEAELDDECPGDSRSKHH